MWSGHMLRFLLTYLLSVEYYNDYYVHINPAKFKNVIFKTNQNKQEKKKLQDLSLHSAHCL